MTRPRLGWSDLPGRKVGIYGLGVEGVASLRACRARGIDPVVVDDNPSASAALAGELSEAPPVLATEPDGLAALGACDVVIKAPGISRYGEPIRSLVASGVVVVGGLGLWVAEADLAKVLLITGTKGKSTSTALAGHLLSSWGYRTLIGGNIGQPPYDPDIARDFDYAFIEVSSYQATDIAASPPVTAVTSLDPDHLPWHAGDVETYYRDKLSVTAQPGANVTVANGDSPVLRDHAHLLGPHVDWVSEADDPGARWMEPLGLLGAHNRRNALIVARALRCMGVPEAEDDAELHRAAAGFAGLPSRLQIVGHRGGVDFVDDSLSTNVLATIAALQAFPDRRVALLVGGQSRGIDYAPLADALGARKASYLVVTMPTNGADIHRQVVAANADLGAAVTDAASLDDAVSLAAAWAEPDGVVLLSPAAPSFDLFRDYRHRGECFLAAMRACGGTAS